MSILRWFVVLAAVSFVEIFSGYQSSRDVADLADMPEPQSEKLKGEVQEFWERLSCDTQVASSLKFSRAYFEEIESFRYLDQPFIHSFAQFTRYAGKRVLEVGFGAGTDFVQWLRAGAETSGIDLTNEALANLTERIAAYQLPVPAQVLVGDAEQLPFESDFFDLGYSFGVLHHTPRTERAVEELVRVVRPGGEIKIMLYNRHSIYIFNQWVKLALLRGKPWQSLRTVLWNHIESIGTKAYTRHELAEMFSKLPLENTCVHTEITSADFLSASALPVLNRIYRIVLRCSGYSHYWNRNWYVERPDSAAASLPKKSVSEPSSEIVFSGNKFGFYHCIRAIKRNHALV